MDYRLVHVGSPVDLAHLQAGGWVGGGTAWSMWAHLCVLVGRGVELGACLGTLLLARLNSHLALHHFTLSPPPAPSSLSSHPAASPSVHTFPSHCALVPQFTPGHITIWEGFTTLGFMPVFVFTLPLHTLPSVHTRPHHHLGGLHHARLHARVCVYDVARGHARF